MPAAVSLAVTIKHVPTHNPYTYLCHIYVYMHVYIYKYEFMYGRGATARTQRERQPHTSKHTHTPGDELHEEGARLARDNKSNVNQHVACHACDAGGCT